VPFVHVFRLDNPTFAHEWNASGVSEIKLQISRRETPSLPTERRAQIFQSYFRFLPFAGIVCLALPEMLAGKIRACYQRNKAGDTFDLGMFATRPLNQPLIRRLVVYKLWQARDSFDPARLMDKFQDGRELDWGDLSQLVRRTVARVLRPVMESRRSRMSAGISALTWSRRTSRSAYQRTRFHPLEIVGRLLPVQPPAGSSQNGGGFPQRRRSAPDGRRSQSPSSRSEIITL
jgi:hypothetical protein